MPSRCTAGCKASDGDEPVAATDAAMDLKVQRAQELRSQGCEVKGTASPASGAHRKRDENGNVDVNARRKCACQQKEGQATLKGEPAYDENKL